MTYDCMSYIYQSFNYVNWLWSDAIINIRNLKDYHYCWTYHFTQISALMWILFMLISKFWFHLVFSTGIIHASESVFYNQPSASPVSPHPEQINIGGTFWVRLCEVSFLPTIKGNRPLTETLNLAVSGDVCLNRLVCVMYYWSGTHLFKLY